MLNKKVIKGSAVLFIAFGLFNFLNFLYQFAMARFLSVTEYGALATLFAIISVFSIFPDSIQTIIAKYTTDSKNDGQVKNLFKRSMKRGASIATKAFIAYSIASILLAYLFEISYFLLLINGTLIYLLFLLPVSRGIAQGRKKFVILGVNLVAESSLKILFGVSFVLIGWKVYGALIGAILGTVFALLLSIIFIKNIFHSKEEKLETPGIYAYARPTTLITGMVVLFYSVDIILAKILFTPDVAGFYAIASILGKIVFWSSVPIVKAMFPLSAESNNKNKEKDGVLITALMMIILIIVFTSTLFYLFPNEVIKVFSGKEIKESSAILFNLGIAFGIISLANLLLLYRLSRGPVRKYYWMICCNLIEIFSLIFVSLFIAPNNLEIFSITFILSSLVLLIGSIWFTRSNRHL